MYLGVLAADPLEGEVQFSITGDGLTIGPAEVRPQALGNLSLAAAAVTVAPNATPGLRSFRLQRGEEVAWAEGFLEILPEIGDVNFDGLDDLFQRRHWPRFTAAEAGPRADPDDDGFDNAWEFQSGSDPTTRRSANFEVLSVRVTAEGALVRSQAAAGKRFQLFTRDTIPGSEWLAVGGPLEAGTEEAEFIDRSATNHVRFYRVQLLP
jgi:hypothetical protein